MTAARYQLRCAWGCYLAGIAVVAWVVWQYAEWAIHAPWVR
jgi:hypothetical protein